MGKKTEKKIEKKEKEKLNVGIMILCIIGAVLTVLGALLVKDNKFRMNILETQATITGIQTSTDAEGKIQSTVVNVSYTANKSDYVASLNLQGSNKKIGDKITLYHDFLEPSSISLKRRGYEGYIALIVGLILVLKTGPRFYRIIKDNYL